MSSFLASYLTVIGLGVGFGFNGSVSPGPLQNLLISETLSHGVKSSWRVAIVPALTDPIAMVVAIFTLANVPNWVYAAIAFVGAAILSRIAWGQLKTKAEDFELQQKPRRSFLEIWSVNITNPNLWIYSFTVNGVFIRDFWLKDGAGLVSAYLLAFFITLIGCNLATAVIVATVKKTLNPKALVYVNRVLGCLLFVIVARFIYIGVVNLGLLHVVSPNVETAFIELLGAYGS